MKYVLAVLYCVIVTEIYFILVNHGPYRWVLLPIIGFCLLLFAVRNRSVLFISAVVMGALIDFHQMYFGSQIILFLIITAVGSRMIRNKSPQNSMLENIRGTTIIMALYYAMTLLMHVLQSGIQKIFVPNPLLILLSLLLSVGTVTACIPVTRSLARIYPHAR